MNSVALPAASESDAKLPASYEAARMAIAQCAEVDECKTWTDKAIALASYARQAKDDSLRVMAVRIQARAQRRAGELLKIIEPQQGKRSDIEPGMGAPTKLQMAQSAGMSRGQMHTALRVAAVPEPSFERQVESATPPTVTQLARQGTASRVEPPISPWGGIESADSREACEALERFVSFCRRHPASGIGRSVNSTESIALQSLIATADGWLDQLAAELNSEF